jgi:hypothetical protein
VLPPTRLGFKRWDEVAEMTRRDGTTLDHVDRVTIEQLLEQAETSTGTALAEVGVPVQPLQSPPQPPDRREMTQPTTRLPITDRPSLPPALSQPCQPRLKAKPRLEHALSDQQR